MHATWFHGHIKHQPASGCRGCAWFITLNYSSHPKLEALGLKTKSEEPKNSCNYVFFFVFFRASTRRRRSVNADNSKYLLLIQIFTEAPMNFCNPHIYGSVAGPGSPQMLVRFTNAAFGREAAADIFEDKTWLYWCLFTWAAAKTHLSCLTVIRSSTYRGGIGSTWQLCNEVLEHNIGSLGELEMASEPAVRMIEILHFTLSFFPPFV